MADRFWVGGTGTWNTTSTTNWSATSGGSGGASVPTAADSVFFDQAGTYTVTMTGALTCLDITVSAGTVTFADGTTPTLAISGSMSLIAGTVWNSTGAITFNSTTTGRTVTTNGVSITATNGITFNGIGGYWTLGSALTTSGRITLDAGTFDTGNFNVTAASFVSSSASSRVANFGSSTLLFTGTGGAFQIGTTGITFNVATSQINFNAQGNITTIGVTFNNVAYIGTTAVAPTISGANTFNNLSVTAPSTAGVTQLLFANPQTINGTLSTTGTAGNRRVVFRSSTLGIAQTLTINSAPSLTDADFRDIYVTGTAAPISGTRIGDQRGCRGITFSAPKTVYRVTSGTSGWAADAWAATSGGAANTNNFPLAQDIAVVDNNSSNTLTLSGTHATSTLDMSVRTAAITVDAATGSTIYGNLLLGSGVTYSTTAALTFSGRNTQTITSAGKTFSGPITVDSYGGTVQLADALNIGSSTLTVTNGTFTTIGYNVTAGSMASSNSNVRTINLGASTVAFSGAGTVFNAATSTNLTFNSGTSTISFTSTSSTNISGTGLTFYNVVLSGASASMGSNTFNNLTFSAPASAGLGLASLSGNITVNGTLTAAGASSVRRVFIRSDTIGTQRTLTVNNLVADDCDFRDIAIAGAAAGTSPTRAGDCGGNSGITFPAPKTVYWNLSGSQNWSATAWASTSGGTPDINNFPLAQDTAVFDNTGAADTVTITTSAAYNIGTLNASARTTAMTLALTGACGVYGNWLFGTGLTVTGGGGLTFSKNGTQTIICNGIVFPIGVTINNPLGTVQLADALYLNSTSSLTVTSGSKFTAGIYNVTTGGFTASGTATQIEMGSGTWTLTGHDGTFGSTFSASTIVVLDPGTAEIVFSDNSTNQKSLSGGSLYYNKLTIGGSTSTSAFLITGNNTFGELTSTRTAAYTINLSATVQTFGKWSVSGSAGNIVTLTGTVTNHVLAGPATSGIDFLAMGSIGFASTSPGEFYAGANSTGTATAPVFRVTTPTPRTLYWVGGTGNWSNTARWSLSSGGAGGEAVPTSLDNVIFDSASNATAYTVTIDVTARCNNFTMAGPASGNVTWAGTAALICHGGLTLASTGINRTYTGSITLSGTGTGKTATANGNTFGANIIVNGVGAEWSLGSALSLPNASTSILAGTLNTAGFAVSANQIASSGTSKRAIRLGTSTVTLASNPISFGTTTQPAITLDFDAGTSQINCTGTALAFDGNGKTFNNVAFTAPNAGAINITGTNTFNNLSFSSRTNSFFGTVSFSANQTINGTLTLSPSSNATYRTFFYSNNIGTQRTLTVNAFAAGAADYDFRDIAIAGAAAPISGTRFGDCKGNSGITFPAAKTVYWNLATGTNWWDTGWAATPGGTPALNNFPLVQDTAIFQSTGLNSAATVTIGAPYNIGTIDMSARTANTMTLSTSNQSPTIYGNWINGSGVTLAGTLQMTFAGRTAQTITSAGSTWTQRFDINSPGGSVTLQDAATFSSGTSNVITLTQGTLDANGYNVTFTSTSSVTQFGTPTGGALSKVLAIGSGTWTLAGNGTPWNATGTNLTVTGTGTIRLTSSSSKTFAGGGFSYSGITLDQAGAGALTITGNNTFKNITNSYSATGATSISFGSTTQRVEQWTGSGLEGKVLSISGTSASSPATIILTGTTQPNVDYLNITNVRSYNLDTTWYAGSNSINNGSLGWYFESLPVVTNKFFMLL